MPISPFNFTKWQQKMTTTTIVRTTAFLLLLLCLIEDSSAFVIAPPWVNPAANPCSERSWQLLYWPEDGKCYRIFEQGPCPDTQELAFHATNGLAVCRCPKSLLYWAATDRCYPRHSRGPCEVNQYLGRDSSKVVCKQTKICDNGWIFWPPMQDCFQLYTQGPCHKGDLLIMNPLTAEPYCGCDPLLLRQYYFSPLKLCYEHLTRGPCESGLLFAYNHTSDATHCLCTDSLVNYHEPTQQCFQFGTKGPCKKGQRFQFSSVTGRGECHCRDNYVFWPANGECYKAFTAGPCRPAQFLVPSEADSNIGHCANNPCPRAHLYFPTDDKEDSAIKCHKVGSRGPCPLGQLVVFEKYSGKSYRGECGCSPGYNQNYWPETGQCFEWYTKGPCKESFLFQYNRELGRTECVCDEQEGFVFWNETRTCYRVYTQGPCPDNAWLIPAEDLTEVFCECRNGYHFSPSRYACTPTPIVQPVATGLHMLPYLRNHKNSELYAEIGEEDTEELEDLKPTTGGSKGVEWSRGVFVTPGKQVEATSRIDEDEEDDEEEVGSRYSWLRGRHQWDWWQKQQDKFATQRPRQPRQPRQPDRRRRRSRRKKSS